MNKIKDLCDKYNFSHRVLGILIGYCRTHIQRVNTDKRKMSKRFEISLDRLADDLRDGRVKIPK